MVQDPCRPPSERYQKGQHPMPPPLCSLSAVGEQRTAPPPSEMCTGIPESVNSSSSRNFISGNSGAFSQREEPELENIFQEMGLLGQQDPSVSLGGENLENIPAEENNLSDTVSGQNLEERSQRSLSAQINFELFPYPEGWTPELGITRGNFVAQGSEAKLELGIVVLPLSLIPGFTARNVQNSGTAPP